MMLVVSLLPSAGYLPERLMLLTNPYNFHDILMTLHFAKDCPAASSIPTSLLLSLCIEESLPNKAVIIRMGIRRRANLRDASTPIPL